MFNGDEIALFASAITIGALIPAAAYTTSCMYNKPCDEVAVKALTPACEAPKVALIALCSDSTLMYSASKSPSATNCARYSEIVV